jgi:hypothetical protein
VPCRSVDCTGIGWPHCGGSVAGEHCGRVPRTQLVAWTSLFCYFGRSSGPGGRMPPAVGRVVVHSVVCPCEFKFSCPNSAARIHFYLFFWLHGCTRHYKSPTHQSRRLLRRYSVCRSAWRVVRGCEATLPRHPWVPRVRAVVGSFFFLVAPFSTSPVAQVPWQGLGGGWIEPTMRRGSRSG